MIKHLLTGLTSTLLLLGLMACTSSGGGRVADFPLSEEPLLGKFVWHDLITDDVAGARQFYGGLFGWEFEETRHPNGGDYTLISADGHFIGGIVQLDDPEGVEYSRWLGYLSVPDVDLAVSTTKAAGGTTVAGPMDLPSIGRAAAIKDSQGAVVGLLRSRHGDPDDSTVAQTGHIVWNELLASDVLYAARFYAEISGAVAKVTQRRGGQYIVLRFGGRDRAGIMTRPADDIEPFWLTHFAVADPVAAAGRVAKLGGEVILPPSPEFRDGAMAVVVDPEGAILALHQLNELGGREK
jgi:predicted enzyme related to lactoylglutathione lyase